MSQLPLTSVSGFDQKENRALAQTIAPEFFEPMHLHVGLKPSYFIVFTPELKLGAIDR